MQRQGIKIVSTGTPEVDVISVLADQASDRPGQFVGVVAVGAVEAYRTYHTFSTERDAQNYASAMLRDALGGLMAAQEWQESRRDQGGPPRRAGLFTDPK